MFPIGLVSVTFRSLSPAQIVEAAKAAGLQTLEWGGDVHVPAGNIERAREVAKLTTDAGLTVSAYGSYYRLGANADYRAAFESVLATACVLGAPVIRIWGGTKGSAEYTPDEWDALVEEGRILVAMAAEQGCRLSLECHVHTLTDEYHAALRYLQAVPRMTMYWQPNQFCDEAYNLAAAKALAPYTTNIHVFHWSATMRHPLCDGTAVWAQYLAHFKEGDHALLLEFMHDDQPTSLSAAAQTLKQWRDTIENEGEIVR